MERTSQRKHAVVLGGSMAGLVAARVLADHFERVTIVERDVFPALGGTRKGVPQAHHLHGLLAAGLRALETLLPGFTRDAIERGAIEVDVGDFGPWHIAHQPMLAQETGIRGLLMSRPLLEGCVRHSVLQRANITALEGHSVLDLYGDASAIRGVRVEPRGAEARTLEADLVVDATGRGSRMSTWLQSLGLTPPKEERVRADVAYTSCYVRREPQHLNGKHCFIISPAAPDLRAGAALAVEGDRYIVTMTTYLDAESPRDWPGMIEFARRLSADGLYQLLRQTEPISPLMHMRDPDSRRRRYERLRAFPSGLLVFGDAFCAFNPAYGQGMSVAALEAQALDACLRDRDSPLASAFFERAARIVDVPWSIVVGGDLAFPGVNGARPLSWRVMNAYLARFNRVAAVDPVVSLARLRVMHLLAPLTSLVAPAIAWRVLRGPSNAAPSAARPARAAEVVNQGHVV